MSAESSGRFTASLRCLLISQPGMIERVLAEHTRDTYGECGACTTQSRSVAYPCFLHQAASSATSPSPPTPRRRRRSPETASSMTGRGVVDSVPGGAARGQALGS